MLLIAHGSRQDIANREVCEMAQRLSEPLPDWSVQPCFLEIASPSIPEGFRKVVDSGCTKIVAVPFFLTTGAHVGEDIPRILEDCRKDSPGVQVTLAPAIGPDPDLDEIALKRVAETISP